MKITQNFEDLNSFTNAMKEFNSKNPEYFVEVRDVPSELKVGLIFIHGDNEAHFTCPISKVKISDNEESSVQETIRMYFTARSTMKQMERAYIEILTGHKYK